MSLFMQKTVATLKSRTASIMAPAQMLYANKRITDIGTDPKMFDFVRVPNIYMMYMHTYQKGHI